MPSVAFACQFWPWPSDIQRALKAQMDKHLHTMVYGEFLQDIQVQASRALCATLPSSIDAVYFLNSGAEAIDAALKLAKRVTGRSKLFAVSGGYHGNTHGSLSVSSNEARKAPFRPLLPEVEFLNWNDITDLDRIDSSVACVLVETVQGDAGIRIPSAEWLQAIQTQCKAYGALFILDEIQCGMGRTGTTWAFEQFGVVPDVLCMGKALGGGMPIGGVACSKTLLGQFAHAPSLGHITTFGGHPMACAGVVGAFNALAQVDRVGLEQRLAHWEIALAARRCIRRLGAFIAVELVDANAVQKAVHAGLKRDQGRGFSCSGS